MPPVEDHSQQRRPLFFPVVIATVLLTIIGMFGGYLLGEERSRRPDPATTRPAMVVSGPLCPPQTQDMGAQQGAVGTLHEILRVRTNRRTVVWICMDQGGLLYYHANKGGTGADWVEGKTALFLAGVQRTNRGRYVAEAFDGNIFSVDRERLLITYANGTEEVQQVVGD